MNEKMRYIKDLEQRTEMAYEEYLQAEEYWAENVVAFGECDMDDYLNDLEGRAGEAYKDFDSAWNQLEETKNTWGL